MITLTARMEPNPDGGVVALLELDDSSKELAHAACASIGLTSPRATVTVEIGDNINIIDIDPELNFDQVARDLHSELMRNNVREGLKVSVEAFPTHLAATCEFPLCSDDLAVFMKDRQMLP